MSLIPTITEISRRTGCGRDRVQYVIRSRGLRPVARAGGVRIFSEDQVELIASELRRIGLRQAGSDYLPPERASE
jgi:DNA-binding transcriptional MerR regulator